MLDKASIAIISITVGLLIIYGIVVGVTYHSNKFIFAPYKPPPAPSNAFYPLGGVVPLTPEQQAARRLAYTGQ